MKQFLLRLWRLEGMVGRGTYAISGVIAFAIKYAIDYAIATRVFGAVWSPLSYWRLITLEYGSEAHVTLRMFATLFVVSLPFLWFGMALTLLRLRDAGLSAGWAALFFVPFVNALLFMTLSLFPHRDVARPRDLSGVVESALFAIVATSAVAVAAIGLSTRIFATYGLGLFIAVPFCVGYLGAFLHARRYPDARVQPYAIALLSLLLLGGFLLAIAWEGVVCLVMALPIALVVAMTGAWCGQRSARARTDAPAYMMVAILPLVLLTEAALRIDAPLREVKTEIVIDAPAERVWQNVVMFSTITETPEWYFRAGIAYPIRARIEGRGPGAIRYCEFSTGAFVEPIEVWDEPRLLRFAVTANPPPMQELSPWGTIDAPHLHGFLVSQRGQFALERLPDGRTRLTGTTWYQHHLWPAAYWSLWSDAIIHRIHLRVLHHIREDSGVRRRQSPLSVED